MSTGANIQDRYRELPRIDRRLETQDLKATAARPFPLLAVFTTVSLAVTAAAVLLASLLIAEVERRNHIGRAEQFAIQLGLHLDGEYHHLFHYPALDQYGRVDLDDAEQYQRLDRVIRSQLRAFQVRRVNIFDRAGRVIYSTDAEHLGRHKPDHPDLSAAASGRVVSSLKPHGAVSDLTGTPDEPPLLETYVPLRRQTREGEETDEIVGVMEIYQDATDILAEVRRAQRNMGLIILGTLGGLYAALFLLVRRAHRTIRSQHDALLDHNLHLEEKVAERTRALESAQERIVATAKLAALGTMAAGVAHEINNPLASVAACAEGLLARIHEHGLVGDARFADCAEYLRIIEREVYRCKRVTEGLLDFARQRPHRLQPVDLAELLEETLQLMAREPALAGGRLRRGPVAPTPVRADPEQIKQIVINLLANAGDAIRDVADGFVRTDLTRTDGQAVLTVSDNGQGFDPCLRSRLMEPFFTTKAPGQGTGLGLAISEALARAHGGELRAHSDGPGRGARFELHIPLSSADDGRGMSA